MKIGVIGAGNVGGALGRLWADKGHEIVFGVRDPQDAKLQELLKSTNGKARAATVRDAAGFGELIVLATPWPATEAAIKSAGGLVGKILVDCTNPLAPDLSSLVIGTNNCRRGNRSMGSWRKGGEGVQYHRGCELQEPTVWLGESEHVYLRRRRLCQVDGSETCRRGWVSTWSIPVH